MRRLPTLAAALVSALLATVVAAPVSTAAPAPLPVPYTLLAAAAALKAPYASPPGANDWACQPSPRHPNPVILLHGASANMTVNWQTMSPLLKNEGYCVFALTYGVPPGTPAPLDLIGGRQPMETSAAQLKAFTERVLGATGARKVDFVGHSEGTLMPSYYVRFLGGDAVVDKYVSITPLWSGTNLAGLASLYGFARFFGVSPVIDGVMNPLFPSALQFLRGSDYLTKLNAVGVYAPNVHYTNIVTRYDEAVVPYTSGIRPAPNAVNHVLQDGCEVNLADHLAVAADPRTADHMLNALDPAHPRPVRCAVVLPFIG